MGASLQLHDAGRRLLCPASAGTQHKMTANADLSPLIHLVDDDDAVRDSLALLISTVGLRVQTWADRWPSARVRPPGHRRHRARRAHARHRRPGAAGAAGGARVDQPIVLLTGHGTVDMCRRAFKAGAAEFLEKPVDDELLLETLQAPCASMCARASSARPTAMPSSALPSSRRASARCWR
jgi:DNA-binding NtrC family response regulator